MKTHNIYKLLICMLLTMLIAKLNVYSQDVTTALNAYFTLECNAVDVTGNGNSGTITGSPSCVSGKYKNALQFDGLSQYISLPFNNTSQFISSNGFTWTAWFYLNNVPSDNNSGLGNTIISASDNKLFEDIVLGFGSLLSSKKTFVFEVDGTGGLGGAMAIPLSYSPPGGFQIGTWYFVAGVRDYANNLVALYFNGVEVGNQSFNGSAFAKNMNVSIGASFDGDTVQAHFDGIIDDVRFYGRAMTALDISTLYNLNMGQLSATPNPIDFGVILCDNKSIDTLKLKNIGNTVLSITETSLSQGTDFTITNGGSLTIPALDSLNLLIKLNTTNAGTYYDTLTIKNSNGLPPTIIPISAVHGSMSYNIQNITNDTISFGVLCPNQLMDTSFTINAISTDSFKIKGTIGSSFVFLDSSITSTAPYFQNGESRKVNIRFLGSNSDSLIVSSLLLEDGCGNIRTITLIAEVSLPKFIVAAPEEISLCPNNPASQIIKITNNNITQISLSLKSSDPLFTCPNTITINGQSSKDISIDFGGSTLGAIHSSTITISGNCNYDTTVTVAINVYDLQIEFEPNYVDFGDFTLCNPDTIVTMPVTIKNVNIQGKPLLLTRVVISDNFTTDLPANEYFPMDTVRKFNITFKPTNYGSYDGTLYITFDTCDVSKMFYLHANVKELKYSIPDSIKFGKILSGVGKDTTIAFYNKGTSNLIIQQLTIGQGDYTIIAGNESLPDTLKGSDSLLLKVHFDAQAEIHYDSIYVVAYTDCGVVSKYIYLSGEGGLLANVTLQIPDNLTGSPGDIIYIPIQMPKDSNLVASGIKAFSIEIHVNPTLLVPVSPTPKGIYDGNRLIVKIDSIGTKLWSDSLTIAQFPFEVVLGNKESDSVLIVNPKAINGYAFFDTIGGMFYLKSVCKQGGTRLFSSLGTLELMQTIPNPAKDQIIINYSLIEEGFTKLYITDIYGSSKITIFEAYKVPGTYSIPFDIENLSTGIYIYILETPNQFLSKKFQVLK